MTWLNKFKNISARPRQFSVVTDEKKMDLSSLADAHSITVYRVDTN